MIRSPCAGWRQWIWISACLSAEDPPWWGGALAPSGNFSNQVCPRPCSPALFFPAGLGLVPVPCQEAGPIPASCGFCPCAALTWHILSIPRPGLYQLPWRSWHGIHRGVGGIWQQRQVWMCLCLLGAGCVQAGLQPAAGSLLLTQQLCEPPGSPSPEEVPWPHSGTGRCRLWDWSHGPFLFFFSTA